MDAQFALFASGRSDLDLQFSPPVPYRVSLGDVFSVEDHLLQGNPGWSDGAFSFRWCFHYEKFDPGLWTDAFVESAQTACAALSSLFCSSRFLYLRA